ncbi:MAG: hypothetical protein KBS81_07795 [Spirochaetales bacterium]|nr:hypothetical protein [Candidatus Physcosoma equi]
MKKLTVMLMVAALVFSLFVSCSSDVSNGLVHVAFRVPTTSSKDVVVSQDPYTFSDLYWNYVAVKADAGAATHAVLIQTAINVDGNGHSLPGTDSTKLVGPFDVGSWTFTFYGYRSQSEAEAMRGKTTSATDAMQAAGTAKVLYKGSTTAALSASATTAITVTASHQGIGSTTPNTEWGKGKLQLQELYMSEVVNNTLTVTDPGEAKMDVKLTCLSVQSGETYIVERTQIAKNTNPSDTLTDNTFTSLIDRKNDGDSSADGIREGVYLMDLTFKHGEVTSANREGIVVIILNGKTTTVSGDIRQLNSAEFNLEVKIENYVVFDNYYIVVLNDADKNSAVAAAAYDAAKAACIAASKKAGNEAKEFFAVDASGKHHKFINGEEQNV